MKIHKAAVCLLFFAMLFMMIAPAFSSEGFPVTVEDMEGNRLTINEKPRRIISLAASTTEILFSLGAGDSIIGATAECDYPPEAKAIPRVGDIYVDFERIVDMKPDLVVIEGTIRPREAKKLVKLGLPVLVLNSANYPDFIHSIQLAGICTGYGEKALLLQEGLKAQMTAIETEVSGSSAVGKPSVFVEIWNQPLLTAGGDTFIGHIIERAGGANIFSGINGYPQVNPEILLVKNPDVIILTTSTKDAFMSNPWWRSINAVKNNRVHSINPDLLARPTLRICEACRILSRWFYPEFSGNDTENRLP